MTALRLQYRTLYTHTDTTAYDLQLTGRSHLRSAERCERCDVLVPRTRTQFGPPMFPRCSSSRLELGYPLPIVVDISETGLKPTSS